MSFSKTWLAHQRERYGRFVVLVDVTVVVVVLVVNCDVVIVDIIAVQGVIPLSLLFTVLIVFTIENRQEQKRW